VTNNGLQTGDVVQYTYPDAATDNNAHAIGGLPSTISNAGETDDEGNPVTVFRQYNVVNFITGGAVDPDRLYLGAPINSGNVNAPNETITFDQAHNFQTGDGVHYVANGATTTVGGLNTTDTYYVVVIDDRTVRLVATQAEATATDPTSFYKKFTPSNISNSDH